MYPAKPDEAPAPAIGIPVAVGPPVVVVGAAGAVASQWSSGLFDCFDDCGLCLLTCLCPCITFGRVAEIVDRGATSCGTSGALYALLLYFTGLQWIYSCAYRSKMRAQFGLPGDPCGDCCVHFCCEPFALCQQYRELKARGFDPELGWDIINAQRGAGAGAGHVAMYAPAVQGMGR